MKTTTLLALAALLMLPIVSAGPPPVEEPQCYSIYRPITSEPVAITLVNSCTVEIEATTGQQGCQERYISQDLGTVRFESRDSCTYTVRAGAKAPALGASTTPPPCMDVYNEWNLGIVTVYQYSSCSYDVKFNDELLQSKDGGAPPCMYRYATYGDPNTVYVVSRSTCQYELYLFGEPALGRMATPGMEAPSCYDIYNEWNLVVVTVYQYSSCSYDVKFNEIDFVAAQDSSNPPPCMDRYATYGDPNTVYVVSRSTCQYEVFVFGEPLLQSTDGGPDQMCMQYYYDQDNGLTRLQMVNSCEAHFWVAGEQLF